MSSCRPDATEILLPGPQTTMVERPTVVTGKATADGQERTFVQWFGSEKEFEQYLFYVPIPPTSPFWCSRPDLFDVVYVGPVKNFPVKERALEYANSYTFGDMNAVILWVVSKSFRTDSGPAMFIVGMPGISVLWPGRETSPREFSDLSVWQTAVNVFEAATAGPE